MGGPCSTYGERRVVYRFSVGKGEGMNHFKDPGIEGRILLRWVFRKWGGHALDYSGSGQGQAAGTCKCGNEPLGSIQCGEFLDWLRTS